jgi:tripartite-type tricarboxylate transporter receptor subunit TctC
LTRFLCAALLLVTACAASLAVTTPSRAGDYPDHAVRFINGFAPGGPVDTVARIMAQALSDHFGQQFVVENRPGAGGNIATSVAIASPPDGYTVLFSGSNNAISASLYKHLTFDFMRDTLPVAMFTEVPNLMVVANAMPVKTVQEFIDYCKANPGKIWVRRQRHDRAYVRRAVQGDDQMQHAARALSRLGAGDAGRDLQQGAADLRQSADSVGTGEERQCPRARRHLRQALAERARYPGDIRDRGRL